jgi:hypothetical protein
MTSDMTPDMSQPEMRQHRGSCHCAAVQFEIEAPAVVTVQHCNCSMCSKVGFIHLIVPQSAFRLVCGEQNLTTYTFNTRVARHLFCKICGVKSFYVPRSNPDGYSVNFNCLEPQTFDTVDHEDFDVQNWEANAAGLRHLSQA